jgi:acetyltransferase-like isoleucine patch superfamily enzyme
VIKRYIETIIRKYKNRNFKFDDELTISMLISFILDKLVAYLRSYKLLFCFRLPSINFFGNSVKIRNLSKIKLGKWVELGDYVYLNGLGKGYLIIGDKTKIGAFSRIVVSTSYNNLGEFIHVGNNVGIGEYARIGGSGGVSIGDNTITGQYLSIHPENHNFQDTNKLIKDQGTTRSSISIGENCWIGAKVTVLAGVNIGDSCVIAAGSVVTKNFPSNSVLAGIPARIIKKRV